MTTALESHPLLGLVTSAFSIFTGLAAWFTQHVGALTSFFGLVSVIFGVIAGYYTIRVQRARLAEIENNKPKHGRTR